MNGPSRGLPPRTVIPILAVVTIAFLGLVGYFLKIGLTTTGAALGPQAQQGDANIRATGAPVGLDTPAPNEVVVPQTGGANGSGAAQGDVRGGATQGDVRGGAPPAGAEAGGPPAPVMAMLQQLRARLQRNPGDLAALVALANLYFDASKYPQAIAYYRRALALDPANPDTRTDYATALHGDGDDLLALHQLDIVLAKQPDFVEALFNEGVVADAIGRRTQAIAAFRRFLKVAPRDPRAADARTALSNLGAS